MSEEYPTNASTIRKGDKVRFECHQCIDSFFQDPYKIITTVEGIVLMDTESLVFPDEVCLSLPQGNFWFDVDTQITYIGQVTPEELDYEYTATYGEGFHNA